MAEELEKETFPMKEFKLSTAGERIAGVAFTAGAIAVFAMLLYALRNQLGLLIFSGLAVVLISVLLIVYVMGVLKASAVVDGENKQLHVRGVKNETLDLKNATMLQTIARKNGQSTVRVMVFSDQDDNILVTVPTMFTFRQGIWADPVAKEIAAELGIAFKQNVPEWEYNKEKYKEHAKELAQQQKKEAQERRQKRIEMRINKRKKQ